MSTVDPSTAAAVRRSPRLELASLESAAVARAALRELLTDVEIVESTRETAVLLANELVINALQHAYGPAYLEAAVGATLIRIEVTDPSPQRPEAGVSVDVLDERGRGLLMIQALAARWGTDPLPGGKTVWCEVDREPSSNGA